MCDEVQKSFNTYIIVIYSRWEVLQIYLCDQSRLEYKTIYLYQVYSILENSEILVFHIFHEKDLLYLM